MGQQSAVEWTDATWNSVTSCTEIIRGRRCDAERLAARLQAIGDLRDCAGFRLTLRTDPRPLWPFVNLPSDSTDEHRRGAPE